MTLQLLADTLPSIGYGAMAIAVSVAIVVGVVGLTIKELLKDSE